MQYGEWDWPTSLVRIGLISVHPSFAFSLKEKNYWELENKSLEFKSRKE